MIAVGNLHASDMVLFAEVVDAGTITAGSRQVGLERSTVSRRMTSLEERLGVPLLNRAGRNLELTEAGRRYYEYCRRVVEAAEEAEAVTKGFYVEPRGVLTIHAAMSEVEAFVTLLIEEFQEHNRNVDVSLSLHENNALTTDSVDGIGFCLQGAVGQGLTVERLAPVAESIWASPDYLGRHSRIETPDDIRAHACIAADELDQVRWSLTSGARHTSIVVTARFHVQSLVSARQAALAGLGLAVLPNYLCRGGERAGDLVRVLPDWEPPGEHLTAVYPAEQFLPRNAKAFLDFTKQALQSPALSALFD
ncbi:MAG: LysR family transcriptional regulator [Pseudomonadota bacterium]